MEEWKKYGLDGYVPEGGYNVLIENLLQGSTVCTGASCRELVQSCPEIASMVLYTEPIDAFFEYSHGRLAYSCLDIRTEGMDQESYQDKAVCLRSRQQTWTQAVAYKYLLGEHGDKTVVSWERIQGEWDPNRLPCRPQKGTGKKQRILQDRKDAMQYHRIVFCGRLGRYETYDMSQTIVEAMKWAGKALGWISMDRE